MAGFDFFYGYFAFITLTFQYLSHIAFQCLNRFCFYYRTACSDYITLLLPTYIMQQSLPRYLPDDTLIVNNHAISKNNNDT